MEKKRTRTKRTTRVPKTRNGGTMTEAAFFQWLRQVLRKASVYWKPIAQARKKAQVTYTGLNKRRKYSWKCGICHKEFGSSGIRVHHVVECGALNSFEDLPGFAQRLFCEEEGLMVVCNSCHDKLHEK